MSDTNDNIKQRRDLFSDNYGDAETSEIANLLIATGDFLERLTWEDQAVDKAMKVLFEDTSGYPASPERTWREIWKEDGAYELGVTKSSNYFVSLNAFAFYGLPLDLAFFAIADESPDKEARGQLYAQHIQRGRALLKSIPAHWADVQEIERTLLAAEARLNLDFERDVSIEQIAALARMTPKSIRNLLTPKSGEVDLRLNPSGAISAADAVRWLSRREGFLPSIWWQADQESVEARELTESAFVEAIFVPVAKDGTWFHPTECRNTRGYTIGAKGTEEPVSDYFEALKLLHQASTPHWRRPNSNGNWGIVAGVSWLRKDATELRKILADGGNNGR